MFTFSKTVLALIAAAFVQSVEPTAKAMFYNPAGVGPNPPVRFLSDPARKLREVNYFPEIKHCGIHYWLEDSKGKPFSINTARSTSDTYSILVRASCNGFLTVFDVTGEGRELTPRMDPRWSGIDLYDRVFTVPGSVRFTTGQPQRLIIVWARSQTEVARSAADALQRLVDMTRWMPIASESEESTLGEIGTYVVNQTDAGVPAEIVLRFHEK